MDELPTIESDGSINGIPDDIVQFEQNMKVLFRKLREMQHRAKGINAIVLLTKLNV